MAVAILTGVHIVLRGNVALLDLTEEQTVEVLKGLE